MLDFDPYEQEIDFTDDHVFQMVPGSHGGVLGGTIGCREPLGILGFVVFKLNVQAVLDSDLHFDGVVHFRVARERVHGDVDLFDDVGEASDDRHPQEVT